MFRIEFAQAEPTWYSLIKDFQPLIAACVALLAAFGAFLTAIIQTRNTRATSDRQLQQAKAISERELQEEIRKAARRS
jgi:hypothetical protein